MKVLQEGGKEAVTEYEIEKIYQKGKASLVNCKLQTGRTHQIRVHMKHIKCPIIGDESYGSKKQERDLPSFPRQALHAYKLIIPDVGEFEAELPNDMKELLENLG